MTLPIQSAVLSRRRLLQGLAAFSTSVLVSGCNQALSVSPLSTSTQLPAGPQQPVPSGSVSQATLGISSAAIGSIGQGFASLSYEKSALYEPLFSAANTDLLGLFKLLGPGVLRIGGNTVDQSVWVQDGAGRTAGQIAPSDVAALAAFVIEAGWQCIYGINLGGAATGATTPELAADEVAYAAQKFGSALIGVEIGNECDGYGAPTSYFAGNWSLAQFETLWQQFRSAIQSKTPGVTITGPASGSHESTWTVPFGEAVGSSDLALLTQHYYRGSGQSSNATAANLLSPDTTLQNNLAILSAGAKSSGIPFRMAECNSYYGGGADGVSDTYASSLWVIDFLYNCAQGGAAGVNLHGGGNTSCYTPIADNDGAVIEARPVFYGMTLFSMAGQGKLCQTSLDAGQINATAYAIKTASGGLNIVVVNKDPNQNLQLTVTLPQIASSAKLVTMTQLSNGATAPDLAATSDVTIQGGSIHPDGSFSPSAAYGLSEDSSQLSFYVPALSAVLIQTAA